MPPTFGHVPGISVGTTFAGRRAVYDAGLHRQLQAGIAGTEKDGADSIVVSGGYEDDRDFGDLIIYTGQGGQDERGRQVGNQEWIRGNRALLINQGEGLPLRVIRGARAGSPFAPKSGFRYDGLYWVESAWQEPGLRGFQVCRFRLRRLADDGTPLPVPAAADDLSTGVGDVATEVDVQRIVRNTEMGRSVKSMHGHRCQVCDTRIELVSGPYAEVAHIKPLGKPHSGPDALSNILCLCPNDRVRFGHGTIVISDDFDVIEARTRTVVGKLRMTAGHEINPEYLAYHRARFAL